MTFWEWLNHWLTIPMLYRTPLDNLAGFCWFMLLIILPIISICFLLWFICWVRDPIFNLKWKRKIKKWVKESKKDKDKK